MSTQTPTATKSRWTIDGGAVGERGRDDARDAVEVAIRALETDATNREQAELNRRTRRARLAVAGPSGG